MSEITRDDEATTSETKDKVSIEMVESLQDLAPSSKPTSPIFTTSEKTRDDEATTSETKDKLSIVIEGDLRRLAPSPKPTCPIFRVRDYGSEKLYRPKEVSIGPFHHGKGNFSVSKNHKSRYLKDSLRNDESVAKYVKEIRSLEQTARGCYLEKFSTKFDEDKFVEILLLDGFFIIELLRRSYRSKDPKSDLMLFWGDHGPLTQQRQDLMLVENQIPFVVLYKLFQMTTDGDPDDNIIRLIKGFMFDCSPWPWASPQKPPVKIDDVDDHLLGLLYRIWCTSFTKSGETKEDLDDSYLVINPASDLQVAGIKFKKKTQTSSLDIEFNKGVLKIPCFRVTEETESILRNMMVYEHFLVRDAPKYIRDNVYFFHSLIKSSKDVEILRRQGILTNFLGDDEMVYLMFNKLHRHITISPDFCYANEFKEVNEHCRHRMNKWMMNLKRNYCNTPWSFISILAALALIVLSFLSTVFTMLAYIKPKQP